jgi:flagellar hook-basal body complex protein FliE
MAIDAIGSGLAAVGQTAGRAAANAAAPGFADMVGQLVQGVQSASADSNAAVEGMLNKTTDVHDAMIAMQRTELALSLVVQVRNKFVQAYQDIMRMPI